VILPNVLVVRLVVTGVVIGFVEEVVKFTVLSLSLGFLKVFQLKPPLN
jgi:hypothetical protein